MADSLKATKDVIIRTRNWAKALRFYGNTLGLPIVHRGESLVGFNTGSFILYVEKGEDHGPTFEFLAKKLPAARKRLLTAGCALVEEDASVPRCYLRDPFGVTFNLGQE